MKTLIILLLAVSLALPAFAAVKSFGEKYDKIVAFFQGESEPAALDAIWESKTSFKIGMMGDGSGKDDYAQHVCDVLYKEGLRGQKIEVKIVDIQKLAFDNKWVVLGSAICE